MVRALRSELSMMIASALILMLEVLFFHTLVYINNYLKATTIISVALLGIALGGVAGHFLYRRSGTATLPLFAYGIGITTLLSLYQFTLPGKYLTYPVLLVLPFLCASVVVAILFVEMKEHGAYFWNLLGAAVGVLLVCVLVPLIRSENAIMATVPLSGILGLIFAARARNRRVHRVVAVLVILAGIGLLGWNLGTDFYNLARVTAPSGEADFKVNTTLHRWPTARIATSADNLVARVDVVQFASHPILNVYQQGVVSDEIRTASVRHYGFDSRMPNAFIDNPRILIVGASAEGVTKAARAMTDQQVVGVEINPAIVDLMVPGGQFYKHSARAYDDIEIHVKDARQFFRETETEFDIITLMNAHTRGRVTEGLGSPQYLFTTESFTEMFDCLSDRGALYIEELRVGERSAFFIRRINACIVGALRNHGVTERFDRHFYAYTYTYRNWGFLILLAKKTPFTEREVALMDNWLRQKQESNFGAKRRYTAVMHPFRELDTDFDRFVSDPEQQIAEIRAEHNFDVAAITDDRPFLFDLDLRHAEIWQVFGLSVVCTLVLILLPCLVILFRPLASKPVVTASNALYFALIGMAFMAVEIVLIQKYEQYLGSPVYSLTLVLSSILLFSSIGSLVSGKFPGWLKVVCLFAIPVLLVAFAIGLPRLFEATQSVSLAGRIAIALATLLPLFFCMGVPFPYGLALARKTLSADHIPLLYGINGAFGTIGVTLSLVIDVSYGFAVTFVMGIALYLAAFLLNLAAGKTLAPEMVTD